MCEFQICKKIHFMLFLQLLIIFHYVVMNVNFFSLLLVLYIKEKNEVYQLVNKNFYYFYF